MNPTGLIRCIAVGPSGHWIAMGQASGFLTILDIRTGLIIASWKGHECEVRINLPMFTNNNQCCRMVYSDHTIFFFLSSKILWEKIQVLQLEAVNDTTIVSSSLDQSIAVWSAIDGKLKFHLK